jgi:hypothetical protein
MGDHVYWTERMALTSYQNVPFVVRAVPQLADAKSRCSLRLRSGIESKLCLRGEFLRTGSESLKNSWQSRLTRTPEEVVAMSKSGSIYHQRLHAAKQEERIIRNANTTGKEAVRVFIGPVDRVAGEERN